MFSRREREFLELLARTDAAVVERVLSRRFPNPAYRRKLLWGIRQKAAAAAVDWGLLAVAAEKERRLVQPPARAGVPSVPLYIDPFAGLLKRLRGRESSGQGAAKGTGPCPSGRSSSGSRSPSL